MKKPILVVLAAGLGSRYGGLKQMAPVDAHGHILIDYAIYDAVKAGFEKVVFIVKPELEKEFHQTIGQRIAGDVQVVYAHQRMDYLPKGYHIPPGREKPWGTAHAVLCAADKIDAPFAVINADDFYGRGAYEQIYGFLTASHEDNHHAMVGYLIENTLTENGSVARGVCRVSPEGMLMDIKERTHVEPREGGAAYTENGEDFVFIPAGTTVSMNLWGYQESILSEIERRFPAYLDAHLPVNPLKCEFFLPLVSGLLLEEGKARFTVLTSRDKWYGVTYQQDMADVQAALLAMRRAGIYEEKLWRK